MIYKLQSEYGEQTLEVGLITELNQNYPEHGLTLIKVIQEETETGGAPNEIVLTGNQLYLLIGALHEVQKQLKNHSHGKRN